MRSGADEIHRDLSRGQQTFETDPELYPINEPVRKLEGAAQCSGEAEYVDDIAHVPGELTAVFVLASAGNCLLDGDADVDEAKKVKGFVEWVDFRDIPGRNSASQGRFSEEIFCSGHVC